MGDRELLVLKNLCVWYTRGKPVLENFSLELGANEVVGLIGLNGAGKTTFIKILSGLLDSFQMESALWQDKPLMCSIVQCPQNYLSSALGGQEAYFSICCVI